MTNEQKKKINELLSQLTSAYQENAILSTLETITDYKTEEEFSSACCDEYREQLKQAGFKGEAIYKGFRTYGDETETDQVAKMIFNIISQPRKEKKTLKFKLYKEQTKTFLIYVIYKDMTTDEIFAHSEERLNEKLNNLCEDENVADFKVFVRVSIDVE